MNEIKLSERKLILGAFAFIGIPYFLFLFSWLKLPYLIVTVPAFLFLAYKLYEYSKTFTEDYSICTFGLLTIILVALLWCWTAGIGYAFYQSGDQQHRNAVFHDLINYNWPVIFEQYDYGLVYYMGIWILPAIIGKVFAFITGSVDIAWAAGNAALLLWCALGVTITALLLVTKFRITKYMYLIVILLILVLFSGLDIVGWIGEEIYTKSFLPRLQHIEPWTGLFQFRSNTTQLFWVYNQAIPCWIATLLILKISDIRYLGFIFFSMFFYAPFCAIGLTPFIAYKIYNYYLEDKSLKRCFRAIFSNTNIVSGIIIGLITFLFYKTNHSVQSGFDFLFNRIDISIFTFSATWAVFFLLECVVFVVIVWQEQKKNPLLYITILTLAITSIIVIGEGGEVSFRASVSMPALFVIMCFVMDTVIKCLNNYNKKKVLLYCSIVVLCIGAMTPFTEYFRAFDNIKYYKKINVVADDIKTNNRADLYYTHNFIATNISKNWFYQYVLR